MPYAMLCFVSGIARYDPLQTPRPPGVDANKQGGVRTTSKVQQSQGSGYLTAFVVAMWQHGGAVARSSGRR